MRRLLAVHGFLILCCVCTMAQGRAVQALVPAPAAVPNAILYKVDLLAKEQQLVQVNLHDEDNNFIFTLPLTFSMAGSNILTMMVGNDSYLPAGQTVWLFSEDISIDHLMRINRNVSAGRTFRTHNAQIEKLIAAGRQVKLYRQFDDGYQAVKKNVTPVFFALDYPIPNPVELTLQLYVSKPEGVYPDFLIAKCKPVSLEININ